MNENAPWRKLIPSLVDHQAEVNPHGLYAEYPLSTSTYDKGYRKITYRDFANVVNGVAWWLHKTLGPGTDFETLAYIGPNDLRYPALILGAVKAGYMMFLTSPRNSVAAQITLLNRLKCKTMFSPDPQPPPINAILAAQELHIRHVPSVEDLLHKQHPHFPFTKTFANTHLEPLFAIHTSGSTGLPKPLIYIHDAASRNMKMMSLDPPPGSESLDRIHQGKRVFLTFPPFHGAYVASQLFNAVPFGTVMIAPTSGAITSAVGVVEGLKKTPADIAFLIPSIVQELSQSPELLDYCSQNLEMIIYCGGDLPQSIGDVVASKVKLVNQYGASELGLTALLLSEGSRSAEDWKYCQFHPDLGVELRHVTDDDFELYIIRDQKRLEQQPTFSLFPELQEYASRDLLIRHPSKDKPYLWKWRARADDIIVFLTGEKTNPISMKQHIVACNTNIAAVLVAGSQRFQAALLVEPVSAGKELSPSERATFIERIWPSNEIANQDCPSHARIAKTHIMFTRPQKPMLRAGKGTIQRAGTLCLYIDELNGLYADADTLSAKVDGEVFENSINLNDANSVSHFIRKTILSITSWQELNNDDDLFALGMDSLQALTAVRMLRRGLSLPVIELTTIYTSPSISKLTSVVVQLVDHHQILRQSNEQARYQTRNSMLEEYQEMIDQLSMPSKTSKHSHERIVILTGSTGALGSYILQSLLTDQTVAHVYCLNRATDGLSLQLERNYTRGLSAQLGSCRVTFLKADLSQEHLGLGIQSYNTLLETATIVIHNAWPVNFNLSLPSFRPQLTGLVNLFQFIASAVTSPHLLFISSISSVLSYHSSSLQIPEEVIYADVVPSSNGYGESKYLSERLIDFAARRLPVSLSFARVGQIAGAVRNAGLWNRAEWFPSLVISSLHVGAIPDSLGPSLSNVDLVPIDLLADVLVELALSGQSQRPNPNERVQDIPAHLEVPSGQPAQVFHPLNPHPTTWKAVRPVVIDELRSLAPEKKPLEIVSLHSWLVKVRQDMESMVNGRSNALEGEGNLENLLRVNPAVKLLGFYEEVLAAATEKEKFGSEGGNRLEITETEKSSEKFRALDGIKEEWIRKWVREWMAGVD